MANFFDKYKGYLAGAVGSGISNQFSALKPFSAAISAGAGAAANRNNRMQGALQGFAGGGLGQMAMGGVQNAIGNKTGGTLANFSSGAGQGWRDFMGTIPGMGGFGTSDPKGALAKMTTMGPKPGQMPGGYNISQSGAFPAAPRAGGATPQFPGQMPGGYNVSQKSGAFPMTPFAMKTPNFNTTTTAATGTPSGANGMIKKLVGNFMPGKDGDGDPNKFLAGLGVSALGAFGPQPAAPDFSGVTGPLRDRVNNPSAMGQAAQDQYMSMINRTPEANVEPAIANMKLVHDREKENGIKAIDQTFAALNPGGDFSNNSAYQDARAKYEAAMLQNYESQVAQARWMYDQQQQQDKFAAANALNGMDQSQIASLASLAQLDINAIMEQTGYDQARAQSLQNLATQAGQILMEKGMGVA